MDDMERYGDYNEIDESPDGKKNPVFLVIKILIALVCIFVIGVIGFRIFVFNYYPDSMKVLGYTDALERYYNECGGDMAVKTQNNNVKYDDPEDGNFFFDYLVFVPDADHIQFSVRYNTSLIESIKEKYGIELDAEAAPDELFDFRLVRTQDGYVDPEDADSNAEVPVQEVGTLTVIGTESAYMYRYVRLAFDGVDFGLDDGETPVGWFRLEVTIKGVEMEEPYMIAVYADMYGSEDYKLSEREVP